MDDSDSLDARVEALIQHAEQALSLGRLNQAEHLVQELVHLDKKNSHAQDLVSRIHQGKSQHDFLKLCNLLIDNGDVAAGNDALQRTISGDSLPTSVADDAIKILLRESDACTYDIKDKIVARLVQNYASSQASLANHLQAGSITAIFEKLYLEGEGIVAAVGLVCLTPGAWNNEELRRTYESDVFRLLLAKLLEKGDESDSRAIKSVARIFVADSPQLASLITADVFDAILTSLDYRNAQETKSPAMLILANALKESMKPSQERLTTWISEKYALQSAEGLTLAFSATAAVFAIATELASSLFLTEGFLPSLIPLIERKSKAKFVTLSALEMLNAACISSTCRVAISKYCLTWIKSMIVAQDDGKSSIASVILAKVHETSGENDDQEINTRSIDDTEDLVHRLTQMLFKHPKQNRDATFEGLAHQSVRPAVKEILISDRKWIQVFLQELGEVEKTSPALFGGLMIIENMTQYLPVLSDEEQKLVELRAYANANATKAPSRAIIENETKAVSARCRVLVDSGLVPTLVKISNNLTSKLLPIVHRIMLSLCFERSGRGIIAQQGGVKLLAKTVNKLEGDTSQALQSRQDAAQALARILISSNPIVLFGPSGNPVLQNILPALVSLLNVQQCGLTMQGARSLLPTFEALLALTNLCSVPTNDATRYILKNSRALVEDLILHTDVNIRRAATELMSNMVLHPDGVDIFIVKSSQAARLLHILLALADAEDLGTRKAAGGALATLTEYMPVIDAINKQAHGLELLLTMLEDDSVEVVHRGIVCVLNIYGCDNAATQRAREAMHNLEISKTLQRLAKSTKDDNVVTLIVEAIAFAGHK